jgi:hypothetical protein
MERPIFSSTHFFLEGEVMAIVVTRYNRDWCNDDQPYWLDGAPALLSVPLLAEWDDMQWTTPGALLQHTPGSTPHGLP